MIYVLHFVVTGSLYYSLSVTVKNIKMNRTDPRNQKVTLEMYFMGVPGCATEFCGVLRAVDEPLASCRAVYF